MVSIKKVFLCHQHDSAHEVHALAQELRLRGLVPWVDKQGGFMLGDDQVGRARTVIREECFGLLFYATQKAFGSDFVKRVELHEAIHAKDDDVRYLLAALPRKISYTRLSQLSLDAYGIDLASYASHLLPKGKDILDETPRQLERAFQAVARDLLTSRLALPGCGANEVVQFQFSSRDCLIDDPNDVLRVDVTALFASEANDDARAWTQVYRGLRDLKAIIAQTHGHPRLRVHGSKHLTAAFMLGYVFPSTAFELELRTKHDYWVTDCLPDPDTVLGVEMRSGLPASTRLHVEISLLGRPIQDAVRRYMKNSEQQPLSILRLAIDPESYGGVMTNAVATAIAQQTRQAITAVVARQPITEIHLFGAMPQALATMIGHRANALPPIHLHEYDGHDYHPSFCALGRILGEKVVGACDN